MSWAEYHRTIMLPILFGNQADIYADSIRALKKVNLNFLDVTQPQTIVLGGFHGAASAKGFNDLCDQLGGLQKRVFLDLNSRPLRSLDPVDNPNRIQADLKNPPFKSGSVDLMLLDYTLDFMSDEVVRGFAKGMSEVLTSSGIILASVHDVEDRVNRAYQLLERIQSPVPLYRRTHERLIDLALPLKPVAKIKFPADYRFATQTTFVAFAKN